MLNFETLGIWLKTLIIIFLLQLDRKLPASRQWISHAAIIIERGLLAIASFDNYSELPVDARKTSLNQRKPPAAGQGRLRGSCAEP
jgi:hypothetical protein